MAEPPEEKPRPKGLGGIVAHLILDIIIGNLIKVISHIFIAIGNIAIRIVTLLVSMLRPIARFFTNFITSLHERLGSYFPTDVRGKLEQNIICAGVPRNPEETLGTTLMYSMILPVLTAAVAITLGASLIIIIATIFVSFFIVWITMYVLLTLLIERRTDSIEKVLPDVLSMISQNMIAGMTPYNALWTAARPEFGPLALEIQKVARDTLAGVSFEEALLDMIFRVKSTKLDRAVKLMIQGMKSGGELPTVLQEIAMDIRTEQNLMNRMRAETAAQAMFIIFAILVGAPLLFASSIQFITIFSKIYGRIDTNVLSQQAQSGLMSMSGLSITPEFYFMYAVLTLTISAFFASLLVGLIRTGKISAGLSSVPIIIALAVGIFVGLNYGLGSFFQGMIAI
ncbi:MAG: type II secretion system F family protein [Candidatus Altiarchaeota archaeon]|nr:type II secretion system F family protein [Candidatus Altiarchaeota archaeon]